MTIDTSTLASLGLSQQTTTPSTSPSGSANATDTLGQSDFLKLMVTQLNNQDPTKPMDSGQFYSQIAQFSTVAGIQDLQTSFQQMANAMYSNQALQASAMVGRDVLVPAQTATIASGGVLVGTVDLSSSASNVQVSIYDSAGQLVRTLQLGPQAAGSPTFVWDGKDSNGAAVAGGIYRVAATTTVNGQSQALTTSLADRVESVSLGKSGQGITLNLSSVGSVSLADVKEVM
jgi:flagellar basal-body rod modification protein FlgD